MISYSEQKEQWYDHFQTVPLDEQYDMFMELLEQNIPDSELIEDDFGSVSVDLKSDLISDKQYGKAIKLIEKIRESTTEFYQSEFPYLSNFAIEYYLYTKDFEKMQTHLQPFIENPGHGYDLFVPLYDKIRFYQMDELALKLANNLQEPIMESDELMAGSEAVLAQMIIYNLFQEFYLTLDKGKGIPSLPQLKDTFKKYDLGEQFLEEGLPHIHPILSKIAISNGVPFFTKNEWNQAVQDDPQKAIHDLSWSFAVYMLKQRDFHFSISIDIWFSYFNELVKRNSLTDFKLQFQDLDDLVGEFFGFFSNKEEKGFAVLWGIPFIYDFLHDQQLVTEDTHDKALGHVANLKESLLNLYVNDIWRFDFVHKWGKPLSINDESFTEEEKHFHQTFLDHDKKKPIAVKKVSNKSTQLSLFDSLFKDEHKQQTKSRPAKSTKKKKRKQAKKQRNKNRKR